MCATKRASAPRGKIDELELQLKRLEWWVKLLGMAAAVFGMASTGVAIWNALQQNKLFRAQERLSQWQAAELSEKRRVNLKLELRAERGFPDNSVMVFITLTNNSTRTVSIAMTGVRVWKHTWESGDTLDERRDLLIYSDNVVAECPAAICPRRTPTSNLRAGHSLTLTPGESQAGGYGPYIIPAAEWARGVWIQAFARPVEQDDGVCVITGPPSLEGGFPDFCEEARKGQPGCDDDSECIFVTAAPLPFLPAKK